MLNVHWPPLLNPFASKLLRTVVLSKAECLLIIGQYRKFVMRKKKTTTEQILRISKIGGGPVKGNKHSTTIWLVNPALRSVCA